MRSQEVGVAKTPSDNVWKEKYVCTIFTVLIIMHVYSRPNGFNNLMVSRLLYFRIHRETFSKEKQFQKAHH